MWDNSFNISIIEWLNQHASSSVIFNKAVNQIAGMHIFKGIPIMGVLWFFWFSDVDEKCETRRIIIATFAGCLLSLFIARVINNLAPIQPRPLSNEALDFHPLVGVNIDILNWSDLNCFPSDHAAMFYALAMGIFFISNKLGYFVFLYVTTFIALPRIYIGVHYPTDIIAGALLGITCILLVRQNNLRKFYEDKCMRLLNEYPAVFQTAILMLTFEMITMFDGVRSIGKGLMKYLF